MRKNFGVLAFVTMSIIGGSQCFAAPEVENFGFGFVNNFSENREAPDPCQGKPDGELSAWNIPLGSNRCGARKCKDGKTLNPPEPVDVVLPKTEGTPPNEKKYSATCGGCAQYLCDHGYPEQCPKDTITARTIGNGGISGCAIGGGIAQQ